MDPQSSQNQKGIAYLNSKAWYRFLKVLYVLILGPTIVGSILGALQNGFRVLIIPVVVLFLLEIPKRSLYYVVAGRVFPNR